ncbi:MAG: HAMP domain-containing histidine kinase [Ramlibacter sp.]|nr:HAMP domain-containing histidine kinase [Ramlibacter sp.]
MTVRAKIAFTIFFTGLLTVIGVLVTVLMAFQRFEHESAYYRGDAFLKRVVTQNPDLLTMQRRFPEEFMVFFANLVLYEPDTQLYLLGADGTVLASTSEKRLPEGFKVRLAPVQEAAGSAPMPYVLGDDPQRMDTRAVIAAKALRRTVIRPDEPVAGYLYLVSQPRTLTEDRVAALRGSLAEPGLMLILAVVAVATLLAAWVTAAVTRPLARLTSAVSAVTREGIDGLASGATPADDAALAWPDTQARDEFGQLARGMGAMLATLRAQWGTLRRLDHFRREGVSNLSHDLRSPLTATAACLETLDNRWADDPDRASDRALIAVALRNTHNAARMVQSLGDLAQLDEPEFKLRGEVLDLTELLDGVAMRFAARAATLGVELLAAPPQEPAALAVVDVELLERAVANLVDNALKFCGSGGRITLQAITQDHEVVVQVQDTGPGIPAADLPHLFDRFYQSRQSVAPATGEGGKGLGLAIVKRIAELHGGQVRVTSQIGQGTRVEIVLPAAPERTS